MPTMRSVTLMTFVALTLHAVALAAPPSFRDGTPAPSLQLPHIETGEPTGLDAFRGKVSQKAFKGNPANFERAQYLDLLFSKQK